MNLELYGFLKVDGHVFCNKPSAHSIVSRIIKKESDHSEAFSSLKRFKNETIRPGNGARMNETKKL